MALGAISSAINLRPSDPYPADYRRRGFSQPVRSENISAIQRHEALVHCNDVVNTLVIVGP
jgi:hypothetical protein